VWTSRRAVSLHVALAVFVPGCVALTWWQASRALGGNALSWVYTVEWPIFAAYATYMWWKLVHDDPGSDTARGAPARGEAVPGGRADGGGAASEAGVIEGSPARARDADGRAGDGGADDGEDETDDELAAYNRYLADLNASGRQKRW